MPLSAHNRMQRLIQSFEQKNEVTKEDEKEINEEKVSKEFDRFKSILGNSYVRESAVAGQTVTDISNQNQLPGQSGAPVPTKAASVGLQPNEALEIAVKRTLASGAPVNDLDFYAEVNWNLNNLGFSSQSAVIIKEIVTALINK